MVSSLDNWDGSLSSTVKENGSRITNLVENAAASTSATTVSDERNNTLWNGYGLHDTMTSLDANHMNDASNLNKPLSRDIPLVPTRKISSFTASSSSPLHNTKNRLPVRTPIVFTLPSLISSPPPNYMDALETISTYTADGDGDEVDIEDVTDILALHSPMDSQRYHEQNASAVSRDSPLFTPPPEEDTPSIHHFTSYPSPKQTQVKPPSVYRKPRPRKYIMSHIEVPPSKRPRSDYRPDYRPAPTSLPTIVHKPRVAFNSIQEAMQASLQNNADIGVLPGNLEKQKEQKRKRTKQKRDGAAEIVVGHPNGTKKMLKRSYIDDDDEWGPPSKVKRPRPIPASMIVDLTITDDDDHDFQPPRKKISPSTLAPQNPKPKVKPTPKLPIPKPIPRPLPLPFKKPKFIHAEYDSETDIVTLCLEDIRPVPLEILTLNTRFLRQSLGNDVNANEDSGALGRVNINCTRQYGSRPCLTIVADPSSPMDSLEEVSVGGVIREFAGELVEMEVIDLLSDSDVLKENVPQKNVPSVSTALVTPSLKDQQQRKPRGPYIKRKLPHPRTSDDVNGSSSTFKVPAPRAIPDTAEHRKTQYPSKKGREPQHGEQQQPRKEKGKDKTIPTQMTPWTAKPALQLPKKPQESQLLQHSQNDSPVRPPHSARSSLNGVQTLGYEADYFNGAMPSVKALGKRRAISPMSISATTSSHVPPYSANIQMTSHRSPSSSLTHNPYGLLNSDFNNPFMDDHTAISSAVQSSSAEANGAADSINTFSLSSSYNPLDTLTSLYVYDQAASSNRNDPEMIHIGSDMHSSRHTSTSHSHVLVYPPSGSGSRGESFFSSADYLNDDVGFPGDRHDQEPQQQQQYGENNATVDGGGVTWSSSLVVGNQPEDQIYAYETIDPTLLGGGSPLGDVESELDAEMDGVGMETGFDDQVRQKEGNDQGEIDVGVLSSSNDSSYPIASPRSKKQKPYKKKKVEEEPVSYERKLPPRNRIKRVIPDMLSHDDIDLMLKRKKARPSTTRTAAPVDDSGADRSSSDSELDDDDDESDNDENENKNKKRTITVRKPISKYQPRVSLKDPIERSVSPPTTPNVVADKKLTATRVEKQDWPLDEVDAYCHQCRRKTFYAKMTCADCFKKFCVRCYAFRYPECEFDADDEDYSCPACEGFCNCTACCRKRGEAYVGVRRCDKSTPPPPPPPKRPRVNLAVKTNLLPPLSSKTIKTTVIPKGATNAWGSLYSVTGERIGACFFDPSAAEKDRSMVFAPATTPIMTTMAEVAQQVVVVGEAAASTSEEPTTTTSKIRVKKKRKTTTHKRRIFIGVVQDCWGYTKPRIKQLEAEPYSKRSYNSMPRYYIGKKKYLFYPVEDDESSLTAMDESDDVQELEGGDVEGKSFLPDSLGEADVSRAIFAGLTAVGVKAVPAT